MSFQKTKESHTCEHPPSPNGIKRNMYENVTFQQLQQFYTCEHSLLRNVARRNTARYAIPRKVQQSHIFAHGRYFGITGPGPRFLQESQAKRSSRAICAPPCFLAPGISLGTLANFEPSSRDSPTIVSDPSLFYCVLSHKKHPPPPAPPPCARLGGVTVWEAWR